jgi:hypothetical protein
MAEAWNKEIELLRAQLSGMETLFRQERERCAGKDVQLARAAGLLSEVSDYLICVKDGSMSRNNTEDLAAELHESTRTLLAELKGK